MMIVQCSKNSLKRKATTPHHSSSRLMDLATHPPRTPHPARQHRVTNPFPRPWNSTPLTGILPPPPQRASRRFACPLPGTHSTMRGSGVPSTTEYQFLQSADRDAGLSLRAMLQSSCFRVEYEKSPACMSVIQTNNMETRCTIDHNTDSPRVLHDRENFSDKRMEWQQHKKIGHCCCRPSCPGSRVKSSRVNNTRGSITREEFRSRESSRRLCATRPEQH